MTRDPWAEVRSDPRLLPDPEPVDLDDLFDDEEDDCDPCDDPDCDCHDLVPLGRPMTTVIPREDLL